MRYIGYSTPDHVPSVNRCTSSLHEICTNLMNAHVPHHQAYAMVQIYFSAGTFHIIAFTNNSHIETNLHQSGAVRQEPIIVELEIVHSKSETNIGMPVNDVRYVNIANDLYDSAEKQVLSIQI